MVGGIKGTAHELERFAQRAKASTLKEGGSKGSRSQPKGLGEEKVVDVIGKRIEP